MHEPISFLKVPIDPEDLKPHRDTLEQHGASFIKIRKPQEDCWYLILLPSATSYMRENMLMTLPDGYTFLFNPGSLDTRGRFLNPPVIALIPEEKS